MPPRKRAHQSVEFADVDAVRDFAHELDDRYLECRELGHLWKPWIGSWSDHLGCWVRTLRCSRCTTERDQKLSDKGTVLTNAYHYPEGYLHAGLGRIAGDGRDALRLESMIRSTNNPQIQKRTAKRNPE